MLGYIISVIKAKQSVRQRVKKLVDYKIKFDREKYEFFTNLDSETLFPITHKFDVFTAILIMISHFRLEEPSFMVALAERVLLHRGLSLFNKIDRAYLQAVILVLLIDNNNLTPKQFRHLKIEIPDITLVDETIKQMFLLNVSDNK